MTLLERCDANGLHFTLTGVHRGERLVVANGAYPEEHSIAGGSCSGLFSGTLAQPDATVNAADEFPP